MLPINTFKQLSISKLPQKTTPKPKELSAFKNQEAKSINIDSFNEDFERIELQNGEIAFKPKSPALNPESQDYILKKIISNKIEDDYSLEPELKRKLKTLLGVPAPKEMIKDEEYDFLYEIKTHLFKQKAKLIEDKIKKEYETAFNHFKKATH